jgi:hypothetical protein
MTTDPMTDDTTVAATAAQWQQIEITFSGTRHLWSPPRRRRVGRVHPLQW